MPGPAAPAEEPAGFGRSGLCWRGCRSPTGTPPGPCTPAENCLHRTAGSCPTGSAPGRQTVGGWLRWLHRRASSLFLCLFQTLKTVHTVISLSQSKGKSRVTAALEIEEGFLRFGFKGSVQKCIKNEKYKHRW